MITAHLALHGRANTFAASLTHLLATHLDPMMTGQAPCNMAMSDLPEDSRLCQKTAVPLRGEAETPRRGKAVRPPNVTWSERI